MPWGEVWRTGANEATLFETTHDSLINGQKLAAGKYAFFTIPSKDSWTLVWNKQAEQWGAYEYKQDQDVLRLEVKPASRSRTRSDSRSASPTSNETTAQLELRWAEIMVPFTVTFDTNTWALAEARAFVAKAGKDDARAVGAWANWSLQNGIALDEAEGWIAKVAAETNASRYHALHARILAKNGKIKEAGAAADKAYAAGATEAASQPGVAAEIEKLMKERATWK